MHPTEMLLPRRGLLLLVLLATAAGCTEAQLSGSPGDGTATGPYPGSYAVKVNPAVASLLIVFICGFFCLGLFSLYLRRCAAASHATSGVGGAGAGDDPAAGVRRSKGLDLAVLETFPTMAYAKAMQLRAGKEALECAVCLSEFSDEDVLRLLPGCCHVFHVHCIDAWLESHVTCPVCRSDLSDHSLVAGGEQPSTIEEGVELEGGDLEVGLTPPAVPVVRRWNSTGHEAYPARAEDRHTLRLPEDVRMEFVQAGRLRRAASLAVPAGAGASGNPDTAGRSGRWGFLLRTFSVRRWTEGPSASAATGSSRRVFPSVGAGDAGGKPKSGMQHDDGDSSSSTAAYPTERI